MPESRRRARRGTRYGAQHIFLHNAEKWDLPARRAKSFLRFLDSHGCGYLRLSTSPPTYRVTSYPKNWARGFLHRSADGSEPEFLRPSSMRIAPSDAPRFASGGPSGRSRAVSDDKASCPNCRWRGREDNCYRNDVALRKAPFLDAVSRSLLDSHMRCPECGEIAFCAFNGRQAEAELRESMAHRREYEIFDCNRRLRGGA